MVRHQHKGIIYTDKPYKRCVGMSCNPSSHNGSMLIEECVCGQARSINHNLNRAGDEVKEFGTWVYRPNL